jgi:hypothetical protein
MAVAGRWNGISRADKGDQELRPNLSIFISDFQTETNPVIFSMGASGPGCKGHFCCYIHLSPCKISAAEAGLEKCAETSRKRSLKLYCLCNLREQERIHGADF